MLVDLPCATRRVDLAICVRRVAGSELLCDVNLAIRRVVAFVASTPSLVFVASPFALFAAQPFATPPFPFVASPFATPPFTLQWTACAEAADLAICSLSRCIVICVFHGGSCRIFLLLFTPTVSDFKQCNIIEFTTILHSPWLSPF